MKLLAGALLALFAAAPTWAGAAPASGQLTFTIQGLEPLVFPSGPNGSLSGSLAGAGLGVAGGTFAGTMTIPLDSSPATGLFVTLANQPGAFARSPLTGTVVRGTMPITGQIRLTGFGGMDLVRIPFTKRGPGGEIVAGMGVGGSLTTSSSGLTIQAAFGPWTSGTATVMSVPTPSGTGTVTQRGFATPLALRVVTPVRIVSSLAGPSHVFASVTYDLAVPEPALPLLFAGGTAVLGGASARRRRPR